MATAISPAQRQTISGLCRAGYWVRLRPTLQRLGESTGAGTDTVVDWLGAASCGSTHQAQHALSRLSLHQWTIAPAAGGGLTLGAGGQVWLLQPQPATRPLTWRVSALHRAQAAR
jgi:hypothetical protein